MAEGLLRAMAGDRFEAHSAGTEPHDVNPGAIAAMAEIGIDISGQTSEHVDAYLGSGVDTVVTVCDRASSNCPVFPERARRVRWSIDDPAGTAGTEEERRAVFRRVREEIAEALRRWLSGDAAPTEPARG